MSADPADYIRPPEVVKARFPADLVGTPDYRAIVDACIERLELPQSQMIPARAVQGDVSIQITNTDPDDFRDGYVTLTVSPRAARVHIENMNMTHLSNSGVMTVGEARRLVGYSGIA